MKKLHLYSFSKTNIPTEQQFAVTKTGTIVRDTLPPTISISSPLTGLFYAGIINIFLRSC